MGEGRSRKLFFLVWIFFFFSLFFASTIILVPFQSSHAFFYGDLGVHPKFAFHYNIGNEVGSLFSIPFKKPKGASSPSIHDNMPK
jgi:hypothetical protein